MGYYYCKVCGNVVYCKDNLASSLMCCGERMNRCEENIKDNELSDKHIPVYRIDGNVIHIEVGEIMHPHSKEHHISFIELNTSKGKYVRVFNYDEEPKCHFNLNEDEKPMNIRIYCNIHGLWKRDITDKFY